MFLHQQIKSHSDGSFKMRTKLQSDRLYIKRAMFLHQQTKSHSDGSFNTREMLRLHEQDHKVIDYI